MMRHACQLLSVKYLFLAILCVSLMIPIPPANADGKTHQAAKLVAGFSDDVLTLVTRNNLSDEEKNRQFKTLLDRYFDIPTIGRFVLGRYWRRTSSMDKQRYLNVFRKITAQNFVVRFDEYGGQAYRFIGANQIDERYIIVKTEIFDPNGNSPTFHVDWRIVANKTPMRILDIMIEGVSLSITQRAEYAAFIQKHGGSVSTLIRGLEKKLAEIK